jgi:hypothetical protein
MFLSLLSWTDSGRQSLPGMTAATEAHGRIVYSKEGAKFAIGATLCFY